jgi:hypothetical protein
MVPFPSNKVKTLIYNYPEIPIPTQTFQLERISAKGDVSQGLVVYIDFEDLSDWVFQNYQRRIEFTAEQKRWERLVSQELNKGKYVQKDLFQTEEVIQAQETSSVPFLEALKAIRLAS